MTYRILQRAHCINVVMSHKGLNGFKSLIIQFMLNLSFRFNIKFDLLLSPRVSVTASMLSIRLFIIIRIDHHLVLFFATPCAMVIPIRHDNVLAGSLLEHLILCAQQFVCIF